MDDVNDATQNLQSETDRVNDLRAQLEEAEQARQQAADALRDAADSAASEMETQ